MKDKQIKIVDSIENLANVHKLLIQKALDALELSYSPYSKFKVGCAILLDNGEIVKGANFENASYPLCLCAERVALASVVSIYPHAIIKAIAVTAHSENKLIDQPITPCGACRQVIKEVEIRQKNDIEVLCFGMKGKISIWPNSQSLLPDAFDGSFL
jgi:cytidine deaminase